MVSFSIIEGSGYMRVPEKGLYRVATRHLCSCWIRLSRAMPRVAVRAKVSDDLDIVYDRHILARSWHV